MGRSVGHWLGWLEFFEEVPEPRQKAKVLYPLSELLLCCLVGVLCGAARAYVSRPWTYWLSPLADLPVTAALFASALRRRHSWRGRELVLAETP